MSEENPYHRRRPLERIVPRSKTEIHRKSFFPSTTNLWNSLPDPVKTIDSIGQFKRYLSVADVTVPPYYYVGSRQNQINHCRLRLGMSNINGDLYNRHLQDNPQCACGHATEDAEHYLLHCRNYAVTRANTISTLNLHIINTSTLLFGDQTLSLAENEKIFNIVHQYMEQTQRL